MVHAKVNVVYGKLNGGKEDLLIQLQSTNELISIDAKLIVSFFDDIIRWKTKKQNTASVDAHAEFETRLKSHNLNGS